MQQYLPEDKLKENSPNKSPAKQSPSKNSEKKKAHKKKRAKDTTPESKPQPASRDQSSLALHKSKTRSKMPLGDITTTSINRTKSSISQNTKKSPASGAHAKRPADKMSKQPSSNLSTLSHGKSRMPEAPSLRKSTQSMNKAKKCLDH